MRVTGGRPVEDGPVAGPRSAVLPVALAAGYFVVAAGYALSRHWQYLTAGYDLGIFDQVVRSYASLDPPQSALKGDHYPIFADHFHPIVATIAPLYRLWDDPRVLLLVQAALVAASIPIVHAFVRRRVGPRACVALTVAYALGWPLQGMIDFDFHEVAFAIPLLAWLVDAIDRDRVRQIVAASLLLLLVREDMGAVVAAAGAVVVLRGRRRLGWGMVALGATAFVVVTRVVIPAAAPSGTFDYWQYGTFTHDLVHAPWAALLQPFDSPAKLATWGLLLAALAFLPLRSPYAVVVLPIMLSRMLADRDTLWQPHFHYNAPVWVVLFLAAVDALGRLGAPARARRALVAWITAVPLVATVALCEIPVVASVFPFGRIVDGRVFADSARMQARDDAVSSIPSDRCVAVDDRIAPHLTSRDVVSLPGVSARPPDYVVLDLAQPSPGRTPEPLSSRQFLDRYRAEGYRVASDVSGIVVLAAPTTGPSAECALR